MIKQLITAVSLLAITSFGQSNSVPMATKPYVILSVSNHNVSATSHEDIRTAISGVNTSKLDKAEFYTTNNNVYAELNTKATTNFVTSQGYVTQTVTNGLASTGFVTGQGYVTKDVTNGLASTAFVTGQGYVTQTVTNGLASTAYVNSATTGLASTSFVTSQGYVTETITNGLATTTFVTSQGYVTASITNGLATIDYTDSVISGRVSTNDSRYLASITNGQSGPVSINGTINASSFVGDGTSITNVNAKLLDGYTIDEIMAVGATYYFSTNIINYGVVTGRVATLTPPTSMATVTYTGLTNGQNIASYLISSNEMPAILQKGVYSFKFHGGHDTVPSKNPTIMGILSIVRASTGEVIQEFESKAPHVIIPYGLSDFYISINVTNDVVKDGYAFLLKTRLVSNDGYTDGYTSVFGPPVYPSFTFPKVNGLYVTKAEFDSSPRGATNVSVYGGYKLGSYDGVTRVLTIPKLDTNDVDGVASTNYVDAGLNTKYNTSNPSNYVDLVAVSNAIANSASANFIVNMSTNKLLGFTFQPTNATYYGECSGTLPNAGTVSVPIGTNGNYALAWGCTNTTFTSIEGSYVNGIIYCSENEVGDMTAKIEIYRRDIVTDTMTEWGDGGATFTVPASATPQAILFSVWVPSVDTNQFRVWARVKRVGGNATSARLLIVGTGSGTPTHFSMTIPATVAINTHNADANAHLVLFNSKVGTNLLVMVGSTTNQVITSPVSSSNTVAQVWRGTYAEYLAITNKLDTTTYMITDDSSVYDSIGIYSELYDYTSVYPTTTVTVAQDKAVYSINLTTNATISVDTNAVNLSGKIANFQLHINIANTNVMSPSFTSLFDWGGFTPEFTVTGRYEYACTMTGDGKVRIKQTYPTVYAFSEGTYLTGGTYVESSYSTSVASPSTTAFKYRCRHRDRYVFVKVGFMCMGGGRTNTIVFGADSGSYWTPTVLYTNTFVGTLYSEHNENKFVHDLGNNIPYERVAWITVTPVGSGEQIRVYDKYQVSRPLNELEIKAYNAGWRP